MLSFAPGEVTGNIKIFIIDDYCNEHYMKYFKVQLMLPGGGPILGEDYQAVVRIDDNDLAQAVTKSSCKRKAAKYV